MTSSEDMGTERMSLGPDIIPIDDFIKKAARLSHADRDRGRFTDRTLLAEATRLSDEEWAIPLEDGGLIQRGRCSWSRAQTGYDLAGVEECTVPFLRHVQDRRTRGVPVPE